MTSQRTDLLARPMFNIAILGSLACVCLTMTGCQDGPMYAMKVANPFYSLGEWKRDEALGVTDHERRKQLSLLADTIGSMPDTQQRYWAEHLEKLIANDDSPEMRRLAVRAAGRMTDASTASDSMAMLDQGLDDDSMKVRMEACRILGTKQGEDATRILVATIGTDTSQDVKHAALEALANHKNPLAVNSLKTALRDRNPATRDVAVQSLKGATGQDYGDSPETWIAALEGKETPQEPQTRIADRIREVSPF